MSDNNETLMAGCATRDGLRKTELFKDKSDRTFDRYEAAGMPVIKIGHTKIYDLEEVRRWVLNGGRRQSPRPRRRSAAA